MKVLRSQLFLLLATLLSATTVSAAGVHIQYSEALQNTEFENPAANQLSIGRPSGERTLQFDAFSQRFAMRLRPNHALLSEAQRRSLNDDIQIYRGELANKPGSWVRLVVADSVPRGMFFDGEEMYGIELDDRGEPIIYRLEDLVIPAGTLSCGHMSAARNGNSLFAAVTGEYSKSLASGPGATQQIDIAVVADYEFTSAMGSGADAAMVTRINNVDGIFSSQMGVQINVNQIDSYADINDPFTDETDASNLVDEVADFRFASPTQRANGLTHLFTGRNLAGSTVGIAFGSAICSSRFGAGLTQATHTMTFDALIAAHEIGHNFGAPHDGEAGGACEAQTGLWLMSPSLNGIDDFSPCSISEMQQVVASASCITALPSTDVAVVALGQPSSMLQGTSETFTFTVNSVGTNTANNVTLDILIPTNVTLDNVSPSSGSCTTGAGTVNCTLGSIASGTGVNVDLDVTADSAGNANFDAVIAADVDANSNNNQTTLAVTIDPSVDLVVTEATAVNIDLNQSITLFQTVDNASDVTATNAVLTIAAGAGLQIDSVNWTQGSCSIVGTDATCQASTITGMSSSTLALQVTGVSEGNLSYTMSIGADQADRLSGNNNAAGQVTVGSVAPPPPAPDSSGGGTVAWLLLFLAALAQRRMLTGRPQ
jgi:hypothetical protein